jgi:molybdopterin-containing oxidoreductase family iron-sulfur binding subunit
MTIDGIGPIERRELLRRVGAALALAGIGGCTRAPARKLVPYVDKPRGVVPGEPQRYATASTLDGYAVGLLVEAHEGRPTKVEGNPNHPASLGATTAIDQASILSLYDPARLGAVRRRGAVASWRELDAALHGGRWAHEHGAGLWIVLEPTSSPTTKRLLDQIQNAWPLANVCFASPFSRASTWTGAQLALGRTLDPVFDLARAKVIVALDSDLLASGPGSLRYARDFADGRRDPRTRMNRLYVAEPSVTPTGMTADHRLAVRRSDLPALARTMAAALRGEPTPAARNTWATAVARDLLAHRGASVVVVGDAQPPETHALGWAMNAILGNVGVALRPVESPLLDAGGPSHEPSRLFAALADGAVDTLVVIGVDLVHGATGDVDARELIAKARTSAVVGQYADATSAACEWSAPLAHPLESWDDALAFEGTATVVQPLIDPLRGGRTTAAMLDALASAGSAPTMPRPNAETLVRATWQAEWGVGAEGFDDRWAGALAAGVVDGTARASVTVAVAVDSARLRTEFIRSAPERGGANGARTLELTVVPDPRVYDGRFTHNAWLLELPDPVTKLTWENAAQLSPTTARALGVRNGDVVTLRVGSRSLDVPVIIVPGTADDSVALAAGWDRGGDAVGAGLGTNAFALLARQQHRVATGLALERTHRRSELALTQREHDLRDPVRATAVLRHASLAEHRAHPNAIGASRHLPSLYESSEPAGGPKWAMTIDLSSCTGCSACVVACQAENNVPVVGREAVVAGRAMHWLRVDAYALGAETESRVPQPMLCQHCEMAPCEYVCPVNATVHSNDGLNEMVYNRCVGTRFCSNNCPYKVRRFNWFDYWRDTPALAQMARNPEVTVRARGVMEKCTFCVQRIRTAENRARAGGQALADGDIRTACEQACPTRAIVFGDKADRTSRVAKLQDDPRAFSVLEELGTRPRVQYLARIRNTNEELE